MTGTAGSTASGPGVVTSGHPLATDAGIDALARGGSTVDAALAAAFTQWVVSSPVCGPGGDLFVLHVERERATTYGGWSRVPLSFAPTGDLPMSGPQSTVVPGALAGAEAAWSAHGRLPWSTLFDHALAHSQGHHVTGWMATSYGEVVAKGHGGALAAITERDTAPAEGDQVACRPLGISLAQVAADGATALYRGELGRAVVAAAAAAGVALTVDDLAAVEAVVAPADLVDLPDGQLVVPGVPSQAGISAELVAATAPEVDPASTAFCAEAAPRTRDRLIERCIVGLPGTAVSMAADATSSTVVVHSLAGVQHGSGWVAGATGIALGNRVGTALSLRPDLPAANPVPGAIVPHTLSALAVRRGDTTTVIATPGGDRQVQWLAQAGQRARQGKPIDEITAGPRWFVCPEGDRFGVPGGIGREWFLFAEPGVEWRDQAQVGEFRVRPVAWVGGGLQAIRTTPDGFEPSSDPRGGGTARTTGDSDV